MFRLSLLLLQPVQILNPAPTSCSDSESCSYCVFRLWILLLLHVQTLNPAPTMCSDSVCCSFHLFTLCILPTTFQTLNPAPTMCSDSVCCSFHLFTLWILPTTFQTLIAALFICTVYTLSPALSVQNSDLAAAPTSYTINKIKSIFIAAPERCKTGQKTKDKTPVTYSYGIRGFFPRIVRHSCA
jgi:hypothetical protein